MRGGNRSCSCQFPSAQIVGRPCKIKRKILSSVRTECQTRKAMVLVFPPRLKCHSSGVRSSRAMRVQLCKRVCSTRKKSMMSMQVSPYDPMILLNLLYLKFHLYRRVRQASIFYFQKWRKLMHGGNFMCDDVEY